MKSIIMKIVFICLLLATTFFVVSETLPKNIQPEVVKEVEGVNHTGGYVYFLKPSTWTESTVMMFIGHNNYTSVYTMTKVSNTDNLYQYNMPSWGGATYVAFANASSAWGSGSWGPSNRTNAPHYTNVYNNYGFNSGSYYVCVPASTSNNAGLTINYKSSASNLNLTTRADVYSSTDGKSYSSNASAGTVSVSGYYMSAYSTASARSAVSSTGSQAYATTTLAPSSTATFKATASTGYTFKGWYPSEDLTEAESTNATYTFKYDISYAGKTICAKFDAIKSNVTLDDTGGSGGSGSVTATYDAAMTAGLKAPTRTGYTFTGYYDASSGGTKYYNADMTSAKNWDKTADTPLYAQWTKNTYTVSYDGNGSTIGSTVSSSHTYDVEANLTTNGFSRTGYTFNGWNTKSDGSGTAYSNVAPVSNLTEENGVTVTLYAQWKANNYTVTLDDNGGSGGSGSVTATYDAAMPNALKPTLAGYTFDGYEDSEGTLYYNADMTSARTFDQTNNITLYAKWIEPAEITLNYNGVTINSLEETTVTAAIGVQYELPLLDPVAGKLFLGWSSTANDSSNLITEFTPQADANLYAQWYDVHSFIDAELIVDYYYETGLNNEKPTILSVGIKVGAIVMDVEGHDFTDESYEYTLTIIPENSMSYSTTDKEIKVSGTLEEANVKPIVLLDVDLTKEYIVTLTIENGEELLYVDLGKEFTISDLASAYLLANSEESDSEKYKVIQELYNSLSNN